ncbi:MAG TPA: FtsX-like permease family protein [Puia sp.]|nr:FtsX-like permease family protein [Puia sp.]
MVNFLFAWRYFKAKKSTNAINVIAWISMTAIIVGSAALILVLSVFNGFEDLVKSLYSSFYTDLKISAKTGKIIHLSTDQLKQLSSVNGVSAYSLVAEDNAILQNGDLPTIVFLKGVDSNYVQVSGIAGKVIKGKFELGNSDTPEVVLGIGIENAIASESEKDVLPLSAYIFKRDEGNSNDPIKAISNENIVASGSFAIQQDFDNKYAFTNLAFMKRMLGFQANEFSAIEIKIADERQTEQIKNELQKYFGNNYLVRTRYEQNQGLYNVMGMEKWVIYLLLTLILIVASFNMVGSLTMLVLEKQKDIHVLKALGASNSFIQKIFLSEGFLLGFLGGVLGILLAIFICWLQVKYKLVPLQGGSFLIDYYPVKLVAADFLLVLCTILVVTLSAAWLPSRKAALEAIELKS